VLWAAKRFDEARYHWSRALFNKPDDALKAQVEEKLKARIAPAHIYPGFKGPIPASMLK